MTTFDNKLTNTRGAFSFDQTIYAPLQFQITNISNPTVTVRNADENGNTFNYNQIARTRTNFKCEKHPVQQSDDATVHLRREDLRQCFCRFDGRQRLAERRRFINTARSGFVFILQRIENGNTRLRRTDGDVRCKRNVGRSGIQGNYMGRHSGNDQIRRAVLTGKLKFDSRS